MNDQAGLASAPVPLPRSFFQALRLRAVGWQMISIHERQCAWAKRLHGVAFSVPHAENLSAVGEIEQRCVFVACAAIPNRRCQSEPADSREQSHSPYSSTGFDARPLAAGLHGTKFTGRSIQFGRDQVLVPTDRVILRQWLKQQAFSAHKGSGLALRQITNMNVDLQLGTRHA